MVTNLSQNKFITRKGRFSLHAIFFSFIFYKEFHSIVNVAFEENYKNSQVLQFFALIFLLVASSLRSTNNKEISKHMTLIDSSARILRILLSNIYKNIYFLEFVFIAVIVPSDSRCHLVWRTIVIFVAKHHFVVLWTHCSFCGNYFF